MELNQDQLALIGLLLERKQMYYRLAYSLVGNEADALDAIAQMTLQVVEKIHTLRSNDAFIAWSKKILVNVCREYWRRNPKTLPLDEALGAGGVGEGAGGLAPEDEIVIRQSVARLPEIHREVVYLRFYLDYEYKDIAQLLDVPEGTVKSRLNRALESLREQMGGALYG
ncbi:MAG: RNA polymerase sigma factor [Clostridiales bacterium]|nr:RNA polymerase sigma factor [Clostridiales bacterium]